MKKILQLLILTLIALCFNGCWKGWGWLVPYSIQPSYREFKKLCKLNELPNDEYKYNKILKYFNMSLDTLDWEKLNERVISRDEKHRHYYYHVFPNQVEYMSSVGIIEYPPRDSIMRLSPPKYYIEAYFYSNERVFTKDNIELAIILGKWGTERYYLSHNFDWKKIYVDCGIANYNMTLKGNNNDK